MAKDAQGQDWTMVLVTRPDNTQTLALVPCDAADLPVLGVMAFGLHPMAKAIDYKGTALVRPWRDGAI